MKKIYALFRLLRFELPFAAGVCVVMGQLLALESFASGPEIAFASLSVFFIAAAILVMNDCLDVESDRVNAPHRPIPSGDVTLREAYILSVALMIAGLMLSLLISLPAFLIAALLLGIGSLYNRFFKKSGLPGNLMVAVSVGMTFVYGGISVGKPFDESVWFFAVIAALIDLGEEIAADAMDMKGDALIASKSIALTFGKPVALNISAAVFLVVIVLSIVPFILGWFSLLYLLPIAVMDGGIAYSTTVLLTGDEKSGRASIRRLYLLATAALLIFLLFRLLGL
jgi:geranylgeranylglycerol-phosphate geranylgeranyltransferase